MKLILANFAHGDFYQRQRRRNTQSAKLLGGFDQVFEFSLGDIDARFHNKNKALLDNKKGAGLWLWKPYFLNRVLQEMNDGNYLVHCDSASIFIKSIKPLIKQMEQANGDMMVFALPLTEQQWTKPDLLTALNVPTADRLSNQVTGSFFIVKKTAFTVKFLAEWLQLCEEEKYLNDIHQEGTIIPDYYKGHRYDQSIFSILSKKYKITPFRDPSQYGEFPEMYRTHSSLNTPVLADSDYKTSILLLRKSRIFPELSRMYMKRMLKYIAPTFYKKIISR